MKTFLSQIPQNVPFEDLLGLDPNLDAAIRDVAQSVGMPVSNGIQSILETIAAVQVAQMMHDGESSDAYHKGIIRGLLIGSALPKLCQKFVNDRKTPQEGNAQ